MHRERLVAARTRMINELRWQLHDLWPEWEIPTRALIVPSWQVKISRRQANAERSVRVQIAHDMICRVRELTRSITTLADQLASLVAQAAPQLLNEPGLGVLLAAKFIGEIAGIDRLRSDGQLARLAGCTPIPMSSGRTDRHRLDPDGNRQLNYTFHTLAVTKIRHGPRTAVYLANSAPPARPTKTPPAASNATSSAPSTTPYTTPPAPQQRSA
ncbi:MAG: transposase [Solirubrobacteraceae bacterium]